MSPLKHANQCALNHFDSYYNKVYGPVAWSAIRVALLTPSRQVALVNQFHGDYVITGQSSISWPDVPDNSNNFINLVELLRETWQRLPDDVKSSKNFGSFYKQVDQEKVWNLRNQYFT